MCAPLARPDYYGASAPSTTVSRQRACPPPDWKVRREGDRGWFPRSLRIVRSGRRPAIPRQHRQAYAAGFQRGLLAVCWNRLRSSPASSIPVTHCIPVRIRQVGAGGTVTASLVKFISEHKDRFGVEPICRVLTQQSCTIALRTCRQFQQRVRRELGERPSAEACRLHEDIVAGRIGPESTSAAGLRPAGGAEDLLVEERRLVTVAALLFASSVRIIATEGRRPGTRATKQPIGPVRSSRHGGLLSNVRTTARSLPFSGSPCYMRTMQVWRFQPPLRSSTAAPHRYASAFIRGRSSGTRNRSRP